MQFFNRDLRFLYEGGIGEYEDDSEYAPRGYVSFMTIHQSKGMEFPVVVVGSLNSLPRRESKEVIQELETNVYKRKPFEPHENIKFYDFWCLFYIAFLLAQNLLVLTANETGRQRGRSEPSKYFRKCYKELPGCLDISIDYGIIKCGPVMDVHIKQNYSLPPLLCFPMLKVLF